VVTIYIHRAPIGDASVRFAFDAGVVHLIKTVVPPRYRKWNAATKTCQVGGLYLDQLSAAARLSGYTVIDDGVSSWARREPRRAPTTDWAEALFAAVGPDRADAVHRALTRVLHPDVASGDALLMRQLNVARDRRGRRAAA
jgi:hypothetical protein